jgi:hypothetical protein
MLKRALCAKAHVCLLRCRWPRPGAAVYRCRACAPPTRPSATSATAHTPSFRPSATRRCVCAAARCMGTGPALAWHWAALNRCAVQHALAAVRSGARSSGCANCTRFGGKIRISSWQSRRRRSCCARLCARWRPTLPGCTVLQQAATCCNRLQHVATVLRQTVCTLARPAETLPHVAGPCICHCGLWHHSRSVFAKWVTA